MPVCPLPETPSRHTGPGRTRAVNVAEFAPVAFAVSDAVPVAVPNVQRVDVVPLASVTDDVGFGVPALGVHVTLTPTIGCPAPSTSRTVRGICSSVATRPDCPSPL